MFKTLRTNFFPLLIIGGLLILIVKVMMPYQPEETPEEQQAVQKSVKHSTDMVNAMKVCEAFLAAGTATKCVVDPYAINVWINTTKEEAVKLCDGSALLAAQYASFGQDWKLKVFPKGGNKHPLATCPLASPSASETPADESGKQESSVMNGLLFILLAAVAYFLPSGIAHSRHHRNLLAIFWLNLLAGWTAIGWLIALIWSLTADTEPSKHSAGE